ncbi:SIR2 family protein [Polynucleobacter sphagniphilus]|uniref:SIR2 family protein n=1 Tax=Polynucleobacter sphagniphilus TaxID=1743169 RepID=UPI0024065C2D|nr:SIR2 family protein [Polynucleobacter sphagniphilus]MDF9787121.1 hypothetical protein [Polynucleobacter sphagniphilus]
MKYALLTGAGFSRNWGGWLSNELIGDLLTRLGDDKELTDFLQNANNFEEAISFSKGNLIFGLTPDRHKNYIEAIKKSFSAMNRSYLDRNFEFCTDVNRSITRFLRKFDSIFTLNQDLLLELNYGVSEIGDKSPTFPGVNPPPNWRPGMRDISTLSNTWTATNGFTSPSNMQPIYKLHGSINWIDNNNSELLIIGENKSQAINNHQLLSQYLAELERTLITPGVRLMVIGYSFQDQHINKIITDCWQKNRFEMYLVEPMGIQILKPQDPKKIKQYTLLQLIQLCGISNRPLSETFGEDQLEYEKLLRFFN